MSSYLNKQSYFPCISDREGSAGAVMPAGGKSRAAGGRRKPAFDETEEEPYQPRQQEVGEC